VPGHRRPSLVVDAAVAEHLEVLRLVPLRRLRVVERVSHADAVQRLLHHAVDHGWRREFSRFEHGRRDVDHVRELMTHLAFRLDTLRPMDDRAVAGPAPVRGDMFGPLIRRVHGVCPTDGMVVVRLVRPRSSIRSISSSGVFRSGPSLTIHSLKQPIGVPWADAPLSPTM
jgi:hypothetical protein